ncbi:MAG: DNA primase [Bacteroidales bacterium]|nr:DNA primase [Bacteroidales bacterium]
MIDRVTIEKIMDSVEIVDVVQDFVTLKKRGVNYVGLCPFHNEKTPSFTVSPSKGIYKCFGCGSGGNAVNFIIEHEHLSYPEALKFLARKYNIEIVEKELTAEEVEQKNQRESMLILSKFAAGNFHENLFKHQEGISVGLSYFKERGFRHEILKEFSIGYCLEQKDSFTKIAQKSGYKLNYLIQTGLTIKKENYTFDRFNGRVIFPIHSLSGQVIGFGGRTLKKEPKAAKYLNSPESDIYHKSRVLYGIFQAKKEIVNKENCFLVEGYTDVLAMHQADIHNVVASSGTSLTVDQIRLIKRFAPNITILFDGDEAGIKASLRGIDLILEEGLNIKVILLPPGEDPDSYSRKLSSKEFKEFLVAEATDFIRFKTNLLLKETGDDPVKKSSLIRDIVQSIAAIQDSINRSVYIKECSMLLKVDEGVLYTEVNKIRRKRSEQRYRDISRQEEEIKEKPGKRQPQVFQETTDVQEKEIIRLLLLYGNRDFMEIHSGEEEVKTLTVTEFFINEIINDELEFDHPVCRQIFEEIQHMKNNEQKIEEKYFINHQDQTICDMVTNLLSPVPEISKIWSKHESYIETEEMKLKEVIPGILIAFKNKKILITIKKIEEELKIAQEQQKAEVIENLQTRYILLNNLKKQLSKDLGERIIL